MKRLFVIFAILALLPISNVYGHGLGMDTVKNIEVMDKEISVTIETSQNFDTNNSGLMTISAKDESTKDLLTNLTLLIGIYHDGEMVLRNYFYSENGIINIKVEPSSGEIEIIGAQDSLLGSFYSTEQTPIVIRGPLFYEGGLYNFEFEIRTLGDKNTIIEGEGKHSADISITDTFTFESISETQDPVTFSIKSYFDKISNFQYDPSSKIITFEMPFDWSENKSSHIPVIHEELHFPKEFTELVTPNYSGKVNGIDLFKASISVDDYTDENDRIVHFVLLQDHITFIKNQLKKSGELPDKMIFTLTTSDTVEFPISVYTKNEQFRVDLSWDPKEIIPQQTVKFVFTIRDGSTGEPLRNSSYDFVIIQNDSEIYRVKGLAKVGGNFEDYTFSENETGPTTIKFENIRDTGQQTEFLVVVAPEFEYFMIPLLMAITCLVLLSRKNIFGKLERY